MPDICLCVYMCVCVCVFVCKTLMCVIPVVCDPNMGGV